MIRGRYTENLKRDEKGGRWIKMRESMRGEKENVKDRGGSEGQKEVITWHGGGGDINE